MKTITQEELKALCNHGIAIDSKGGYPAVVLHPDDTVTKIWARKKGIFSSSTLNPYSNRFVRNAAKLAEHGIVVPEILDHAKLIRSHVRIVTYRSIPGKSIRELLRENPSQINIPSLAKYIIHLHDRGISFGGMHLGNIIQLPEESPSYGLIDFTDVRFYKKPLTPQQRAANLTVPLRYSEDINYIQQAGHPDLLETYLTHYNPTPAERVIFKKYFPNK